MIGTGAIGRAESDKKVRNGWPEISYSGSGEAFAEIILPDPDAFDFSFLQQVINMPEYFFLDFEMPYDPGAEAFPGPSDVQVHPFFVFGLREFSWFYSLVFCQFNE